MDEYISREAVFQVVHGIARGIADRDIEAFKEKDMKAFYMAKGAKKILDSVDTDLCYIPSADVQSVKHGRCVIDNEGYERCSVCNEHETGMRYFTFCPRCGARMDLKDGDTNG